MEEKFHQQDTLPLPGAKTKKPPSEPLPEHIGPYKIEAFLEKGGMSILYLATHPETKEPITVKVLSPKYVSNKEVVKRFLQEAEIIGLTDHPNIVKLYGQGEWEGGLYIAMEFIRGISLRQYILRNFMTLHKALEIGLEIAYALCHLHSHGIIHRDLKPENILINEAGQVKIIDFGIAQLLTVEAEEVPEGKRRLIGTPIYMSPEQKEHPESVSYPSDIYSLGIITYELVLGKLSHGLIHLSLMPYGLQKILAKCLQPNPEHRYLDVVDFITDISKYMNSADLRKDNTEKDQIERLSANLKRAQQTLSPHGPPDWPDMTMGLASHKGLNIFGMYYDFVPHPNNAYGMIIGEPSTKGAEGFIYTSVLRGMVRAISRLTNHPQEMATVLNELLINDQMKPIISLSYLVLLPEKREFRFLSCGNGSLWFFSDQEDVPVEKISSEHVSLGLDPKASFTEIARPWNPGESLLLQAFSTIQPETKEELLPEVSFTEAVVSTRSYPPQQQVDTLLAKAKIDCSKSIEDCSMILIRAMHL